MTVCPDGHLPPRDRQMIDIDFPDAPVEFFQQHGFSGAKGHIPPAECEGIAARLWAVHERLLATRSLDASPMARMMPWPIADLPRDLVHDLRLAKLTVLARELLGGQEPHVFSWQAFARTAHTPATPWHRDDVAIPIEGPAFAFWIPLTPTPTRTGLVALANVDGTGPRPVRQGNLDPGDLTWHNMVVTHQAETVDVDFIAFGIAIAGANARISLGDMLPLRVMGRLLRSRISTDLVDGGGVVTQATPVLSSLGTTMDMDSWWARTDGS